VTNIKRAVIVGTGKINGLKSHLDENVSCFVTDTSN
jgi:hypothetical protein